MNRGGREITQSSNFGKIEKTKNLKRKERKQG